MKVLVIAAHPDDEIYGMGGTIAKFCSEGNEVHVLIVTEGSSSQYKEEANVNEIIKNKKREATKANRVLGVKTVHFGDLQDMRLDGTAHIEINEVIEKTIELVQPTVVFTHFYGDVNLDHQRVFESTMVATRPTHCQCVKEVYAYSVPSSTEWSPQQGKFIFMPNVFYVINEFLELKHQAIKMYETEIRNYPHPRSVEYVKKLDEVAGIKVGVGYAEEFVLLRKIAL